MRRRHLLALVILALVVATVLAMGPVLVWDAVTLKTVEAYYGNGALRWRCRVRFWSEPLPSRSPRLCTWWYPTGEKYFEFAPSRAIMGSGVDPVASAYIKDWSRDGHLTGYIVYQDGRITGVKSRGVREHFSDHREYELVKQDRYVNGEIVETRTSPPWFTEEEILRAVEGVEE